MFVSVTMRYREAFESCIQENILQPKYPGSKTITRSKGVNIVSYLTGRSIDEDDHFRFWVKSRGFKVMDYPALGLQNILCVPAKKKVCSYFI